MSSTFTMEKGGTGRIPRELMHDQNDRLSNKHIQTLGFLQEVVNENKALKQRLQELEVNRLQFVAYIIS